MGSKFFEELSRCLGKEQIESLSKEDRRLEIFLHGQPVLSVSPGNEVFMLPSGSKNPEANELYHRVAIAADRVFEYLDARNPSPSETDFFTVTRMDAWGVSTWFMCTPEAAGKLIAMDYDNLAVKETTIVG